MKKMYFDSLKTILNCDDKDTVKVNVWLLKDLILNFDELKEYLLDKEKE